MARGRFDSTRVPSRTLRYARNVYLTVRLIEANRAILSAYTRTSVRYATRRDATRLKALIRRTTGCSDLIAFLPQPLVTRYSSRHFGQRETRTLRKLRFEMLPARRSRREKGKGLRGRLARKKEKGANTGGPCGTKRGKPIGRRSKKEAEDARVRRELWLSSDARVLRRGRGTEQRSRECDRDRILDWLKRRKMKQTQTEDRHLLGNECNFIVNLSLSESKQWYDLCTICPCNLLSPPPRRSSSPSSSSLFLFLPLHLPHLPRLLSLLFASSSSTSSSISGWLLVRRSSVSPFSSAALLRFLGARTF